MELQQRPRLPVMVYRAVQAASNAYNAIRVAQYMMGSAAPTEADIKVIYKSAKKYMKGRSKPKGISRGTLPRQVKGLKNQVRELRRVADSDTGTHIHRGRSVDRITTSTGTISHAHALGYSVATIESALANLLYYDIATPATLVTASGVAGNFSKEFYFKRAHCKLVIRANGIVPAKVTVYTLTPRVDNSFSPVTLLTNGLVDVGNPSNTSPLVYLTDSSLLTDNYVIRSTRKKVLLPGQEMSVSHSSPSFTYDPSVYDTNGLAYMKSAHTTSFVIRVEGCLGHDTVQNEQAIVATGVDYYVDRVFEIKYSAGADIKQIFIDDESNTFTTSGVVTLPSVADNMVYSQS